MLPLFVYGTLRRGEPNAPLLARARFIGEARTDASWSVVDLGAYPALVPGTTEVVGELYEVDAATYARLDDFEGHPDLFERIDITLACGRRAQVYAYARADVGLTRVVVDAS